MPRIGIVHPDHKLLRVQKSARIYTRDVSAIPSSGSLENFEAPIMDQGSGSEGTGSCVGHGTSQGLVTSFAAAGKPLAFVPSQRVNYDLARILDRTDASQGLQDIGAMPGRMMQALSLWGITAMTMTMTPDGRFSDVTVGNVNDEPGLLELEDAGLKLVTGEYRIDETATDFTQQICAAITGGARPGCAVGIGAFVDTQNFMAYDGNSPITTIDMRDPQGGGHWFIADYYYTLPSGAVILGGPNSWGAWGKQGHFEIYASALQKATSDAYLFNVGG